MYSVILEKQSNYYLIKILLFEVTISNIQTPATKLKRQERLQEVDELLERSKQQQDALNQKKTEYENANLSVSNFCNQAFSVLALFLLEDLP